MGCIVTANAATSCTKSYDCVARTLQSALTLTATAERKCKLLAEDGMWVMMLLRACGGGGLQPHAKGGKGDKCMQPREEDKEVRDARS